MILNKNTSITALAASSISRSPFFSLSSARSPYKFTLKNSRFNKFSSNLLRSHTDKSNILLQRSTLSNFLDTSIYVNSDVVATKVFRELYVDKPSSNLGKLGDAIACQEMIFVNCSSDYDGGAVFVVIGGPFYCNFTAFKNCYTKLEDRYGGAVYCICGTTNFTGSCFTHCSASKGACYHNPETTGANSNELCQFNDIDTLYECKNIINTQSRDITVSLCNVSNVKINNLAKFIPTQKFRMNFTNYENIVVEDMANDDGTTDYRSILSFKRVNTQTLVKKCNLVKSKASFLFALKGTGLNLNEWTFAQNEITQKKLADVDDGTPFTLIMTNCVSDFAEKFVTDSMTTNVEHEYKNSNSKFDVKDVSTIQLDVVSTVGCWAHSTYKWSVPSKTAQISILSFLVVSVVVTCILLYFNKRKLDSLAPKDEDNSENEDNLIGMDA